MSTIVGNTIVYSIAGETLNGSVAEKKLDVALKLSAGFSTPFLGLVTGLADLSSGVLAPDVLILDFGTVAPIAADQAISDPIVAAHDGIAFAIEATALHLDNRVFSRQLVLEDESQPDANKPYMYLQTAGGVASLGIGDRVLGVLSAVQDVITINELGDVGIGVANPACKLHLNVDAAVDVDICLDNDAGGGQSWRFRNAGGGLFSIRNQTLGENIITVNSGATKRAVHVTNTEVRFNNDNKDLDFSIRKNVSGDAYSYDAGTDEHKFSAPIQVEGPSNQIRIVDTDDSASWTVNANGGGFTIQNDALINVMVFDSGITSEALRINLAGNVGIGGLPTTGSKFEVVNNTSGSGASSNHALALRNPNSTLNAVISQNFNLDGSIRAFTQGQNLGNVGGAQGRWHAGVSVDGVLTRAITIDENANVGIGTTTPIAPLDVAGDVHVAGNLLVDGTTTTLSSETVNLADNHLTLNAGYTAAVAQTAGLVANFLPTATVDSVTSGAFVAGVAAVSNPTVETVGAATFAAGALVQFSVTLNGENDGVYEVLSHAANLLTLRGVGLTATVEDFTANQLTANPSSNATITQVTVSVMRAGLDGVWETARGSVTGLAFQDFATTTGAWTAGSVVFADPNNNLNEDNANFFWDDTGNNLGIRTNNPLAPLHVDGTTTVTGGVAPISGLNGVHTHFVADVATITSTQPGVANRRLILQGTPLELRNGGTTTALLDAGDMTVSGDVSVGANLSFPVNAGVLELPEHTTASRTALPNGVGHMVYDTDIQRPFFNTGTAWVQL